MADSASSITSDVADTSSFVAGTTLSSTDVLSSTTEVVPNPPNTPATVSTITSSAATSSFPSPSSAMSSNTPSNVSVSIPSSAISGGESSVSTSLEMITTSDLTTPLTTLATNIPAFSDPSHAISSTNVIPSSTMTSTKATMRISSTTSQAFKTEPIGWVASTAVVVPMTSETMIILSTMETSGHVSSSTSTSSYTASANGSTSAMYDARHHFTRPEKVVAAVMLPIAFTVIAAILALVVWLEHVRRHEQRTSTRRFEKLSTPSTRASLSSRPGLLPPRTTSRNLATMTAPPGLLRSVDAVQGEGGSATGSTAREPSLVESSAYSQALDEDYHYILKDL
ncbi:hypothetical protein LTR86_010835 [Recurvomyces mirabilis]|nr:hypothetical protein LTR86_010835 [Recurvomyces mirabilis]